MLYSLYAMEQEGLLSTRQGKINQIIKLLVESEDPNNFEIQCNIYKIANFNSETLTEKEINYIEKEIIKRRRF